MKSQTSIGLALNPESHFNCPNHIWGGGGGGLGDLCLPCVASVIPFKSFFFFFFWFYSN